MHKCVQTYFKEPLLRAGVKVLRVFTSAALVLSVCVPSSLAVADEASNTNSMAPVQDQIEPDQVQEATVQSQSQDISGLWEQGNLVISTAGTYVLSRDVSASTPLTVSLPADQQAVIDFAGHTANIEGENAIDLSANLGTVDFIDSAVADSADAETAKTGGVALNANNPQTSVTVVNASLKQDLDAASFSASFKNISLVANVVASSATAYQMNTTLVKTAAPALSTSESATPQTLAVSFADCKLGASVKSEVPEAELEAAKLTAKDQGALVGIDAEAAGVSLLGHFTSELSGASSATDVRAWQQKSFIIASDFSPASQLSYKVAGTLVTSLPAAFATSVDNSVLPDKAEDMFRSANGLELKANEARTELIASAVANHVATETAAQSSVQVLTLLPSEAFVSLSEENQSGTDLNIAWEQQEGGLSNSYTISTGGTYYLSSDLTAENHLIINTPTEEVTLRFNGHTLTVPGSDTAADRSGVKIVAARSVTFDGTSGTGTSLLTDGGAGNQYGIHIMNTAVGCSVQINNLSIQMAPTSTSLRNLGAHCVRAMAGSLSMNNCACTIDFGNQAVRTSVTSSAKEPFSAIYATDSVSDVSLVDCNVKAVGTPGFAPSSTSDLKEAGNAYGVYTEAQSNSITGGSFEAVSAIGSAAGICASALSISGTQVSLAADAQVVAAGIVSTNEGGVAINAPLNFTQGNLYTTTATVGACLRGKVDSAFAFAEGFLSTSEGSCPVLIDKDTLENANGAYDNIATFSDLSFSQRRQCANILANASPYSSCSIQVDGATVCFVVDSESALARIDSTYFATMSAALSALRTGKTLELLADTGSFDIPGNIAGTIDLGGHSVGSITFGVTKGTGGTSSQLIIQNGTVGAVCYNSTNNRYAGVTYASLTTLTLRNMRINVAYANSDICAVNATTAAGKLVLDNCQINVVGSRTSSSTSPTASGVYFGKAQKGSLEIKGNTQINVSAASAGMDAFGIYSFIEADINDCSVNVEGSTGTAAGIYLYKSSSVAVAHVNASATADAGNVYGIMGQNTLGNTYAIDSCSISVTSKVNAPTGSYRCLQNGTVSTNACLASWSLSGMCSFKSCGEHMGPSMSAVSIDSSFSLAPGSDEKLNVRQYALVGNVAFTSSDGSDISSLADIFVPTENSSYSGRKLMAAENGSTLVWIPEQATDAGSVKLVRANSVVGSYNDVSSAITAARSGDTVKLTCDISEFGSITVSQKDLAIDLAGHTFTLASGSTATDAVAYSGAGTLKILSSGAAGTLNINAGTDLESKDCAYQGIVVSGGGTVSVEKNATVSLAYVGGSSTTTSCTIDLRAIALTSGTLNVEGTVRAHAPASVKSTVVVNAVGVYAQAAASAHVVVNQSAESTISADNDAPCSVSDTIVYPESTQSGTRSYSVRELKVDPTTDAQLYNAIQSQFKISASYDDPDDFDSRSAFGAGIYYVSAYMTLNAPNTDYDGMKIWAYSDVVDPNDVGKASSMVATHIFVQTPAETLPSACAIACASDSAEGTQFNINGSVEALCENGSAIGVDAQSAANSTLSCNSATIAVNANTQVHSIAGNKLDLRNYIDFGKEFESEVSYRGGWGSATYLASFGFAECRGIAASTSTKVVLDGQTSLTTEGTDAASIEADQIYVGSAFGLSGSTQVSVASTSGSHNAGDVFALKETSSQQGLKTALFCDASGAFDVSQTSDGNLAWADAPSGSYNVTFKVGAATVKTYRNPTSINLSELSYFATRVSDARNAFTLVGWSTNSDDNAQSGYISATEQLHPTESAVYYAVYRMDSNSLQVSYAGVHNADGSTANTPRFSASYGVTLAEALSAAGQTLVMPENYTDADGTRHVFVGWHPYSSSSLVSSELYSAEYVASKLCLDANTSGVTSGNLVLQAVYAEVPVGYRLVEFDNEWMVSYAVVPNGQTALYTDANPDDSTYNTPSLPGISSSSFSRSVESNFKGWIDVNSGIEYGPVTPTGESDARYKAHYDPQAADVEMSFSVMSWDAEGSLVRMTVYPTGTYASSPQEIADSVIKEGDTISSKGVVYEFKGWGVRSYDVDPVFNAANPLPSYAQDSSVFSRTYYGIYEAQAHTVDVKFYDGDKLLGSTNAAVSTTINDAFSATGATTPSDRSSTEVFLGWNNDPSATTALNATSETIASILGEGSSADTLTLYAIYGVPYNYSVMFYNTDKITLVASLSVPGGKTVNQILKEKDITLSRPSSSGCYFKGWQTAGAQQYSLDTPVTGALRLYPLFGTVTVSTKDATDINATVAVNAAGLDDATDVTFAIKPRTSADTPLRAAVANMGFSMLKYYDIVLTANDAEGKSSNVTGSFGQATFKVNVGTQYANMTIGAFWLNELGVALNSEAKTVDSEGYITFTINNYGIGDSDEGGNLCIAYVLGSGKDIDKSSNGISGLKKTTLSTSGLSSLSTASLAAAAVSAETPSSAKITNPYTVDTGDQDESVDEANAWDSQGWDANTVVFVLIFVLLVLCAAWGIQRLIATGAARRKEDEEPEESQEPLENIGIRF